MNAVKAYRMTFPDKKEQIEKTPDPAIREMLLRSEQLGIDTTFDRFDQQQPQCNFGLAGICCKICNMGPCRITKKSKRGVCGADADLIVARNLLRSAAAGAAQHGMHARELMLELLWAADGKLDAPLLGEQKIMATAKAFGIDTEGRDVKAVAHDLANALLADLSSPDPSHVYKTAEVCAPADRVKLWKDLDLMPISAYHEVFEAYHKTAVGTDGDWKSIMEHFLRCGLAFCFTGVAGASIATDSLFGVGDRVTSKVNIGALKKGYVNIAVHGHLPLLLVHPRLQRDPPDHVPKKRGVRALPGPAADLLVVEDRVNEDRLFRRALIRRFEKAGEGAEDALLVVKMRRGKKFPFRSPDQSRFRRSHEEIGSQNSLCPDAGPLRDPPHKASFRGLPLRGNAGRKRQQVLLQVEGVTAVHFPVKMDRQRRNDHRLLRLIHEHRADAPVRSPDEEPARDVQRPVQPGIEDAAPVLLRVELHIGAS